jgi:hypothetical protein
MVELRTVDGLLDEIKARNELRTDWALAKHLKVRIQVLMNYRKKRSLPDDVMAIRLADELGLDRGYVLASIAAERANRSNNPNLADTWREMAEKLGIAIVTIFVVQYALRYFGVNPEPIQALIPLFFVTENIHYTQYNTEESVSKATVHSNRACKQSYQRAPAFVRSSATSRLPRSSATLRAV